MSLDGFTWEGANNAWNYLDRLFDLGAFGGFAALVTQPRVGLCPDGRRRFRARRRYHSRAHWAYLNFAPVGSGPFLRSSAGESC